MGSNHIINDYIAGAIGGASGLAVGHPFDTTKVQMQTQQTTTPYKGTMDAVRNINRQGWARGFYRGLGFPLASYGVVNSVFFGVYGNTLRVLNRHTDAKPSYTHAFTAGCVAGFAQLFVACPVDVVKVVLQSQISRSHTQGVASQQGFFRGPSDCIRWLLRNHGLKGMYQGFSAMAVRDVGTFGVYTLVYEVLFDRITGSRYSDAGGVVASLCAGGCAGVACWSLAIPGDNVKSLMQADKDQTRFKSAWACARYLYSVKGVAGFFTGLGVTCVRAFPVNAVTFMVYAQCLKRLNRPPADTLTSTASH